MTFEEVLERDGVLIYTNKGCSMNPWVYEGRDVMVIKPLKEKPKKWDSVLFKRPGVKGRGEYVMHRVIKVLDNDEYFIIGDNTISGEVVKLENILGLLTSIKNSKRTIDVNDTRYIILVRLWWYFAFPVRTAFRYFKIFVKKLIGYKR